MKKENIKRMQLLCSEKLIKMHKKLKSQRPVSLRKKIS